MKTLAVGPQETCVMAQNVCKGRLQPLEKKVEQYTNSFGSYNKLNQNVFFLNRISKCGFLELKITSFVKSRTIAVQVMKFKKKNPNDTRHFFSPKVICKLSSIFDSFEKKILLVL